MSDPDLRAALEALVGRTVQGRYRIDAVLGMGGMGGVFRAHHLGLGQDVALKVLHPGVRVGEIAAARFEREARSASRLDHPNCVRVTDFGELEDGTKFLVMQLLAGEELRGRLGAPFDPMAAIEIALQILAGLAHAHARGVVHRDLKPENVLLTRDHGGRLQVKLVDFGIAKLLEGDDADPKLTRTGMLFGTPRYMSPEQAGGGKVDARTDLYAVGLLLYEMLAGRPPFEAGDVATLMRMHVLVPPPALPETVPVELRAAVVRLLAKSRADRFASAEETAAALRAALVEPIATAASTTASTGPWVPPMAEAAPTVTIHPGAASQRFTAAQLTGAAIVLVLFWIGIAVAATIDFDEPSTPAPTPSPTSAAAAAPAHTPTMPKPMPPQPSDPAMCRGDACECDDDDDTCTRACADDCELECEGHGQCRFTCGADCDAKCDGKSGCELDVGEGSRVECGGHTECEVTCRGQCVVRCKGKASCELRCLDAAAPGPSRCDKDTYACGEC